MNPFLALAMIIPGPNLWLGYRAFACPPNYAFRRKLGVTGIGLGVVYWLTMSLIAMLFAAQFKIIYQKYKEGEGEWHERLQNVVYKLIGKEIEEEVEEEEDF